MNREIKFRGKIVGAYIGNDPQNKWFYGSLVKELSTGKTYILDVAHTDKGEARFNTLGLEVDPNTVGQFTGLKDKNGKEIYTGHIVKYVCKPHEWHFVILDQQDKYFGLFKKCIYRNFNVVENESYEKETVFGDFHNTNEVSDFSYINGKQYEIIGSIHD